MDSSIIVDPLHEAKIEEWLKSAKRSSYEPKLFYRASRDGWDASDFHRTCDGVTNTLTVIKSATGYIFGGYSDLSWSSSTGKLCSESDAFLFHLHSYAGLAPGKLGNNGSTYYTCYVTQPSTSRGPRFGYNSYYGGCYDLYVVSSPNRENSTINTNLGNSSYSCYPLPSGQASTFLVGGSSFLTSELEVFEV